MSVTVLLVDDDALVRAGLRAFLAGSPEIEVMGEASDGAEGIRRVAELAPDVVLMDIRMPNLDGVAATERIRAGKTEGEAPQVLVLTTFDSDDSVASAIRAGAKGYLLKDAPPEDIIDGIRAVRAGRSLLSPSLASTLLEEFAALIETEERVDDPRAALTDRERALWPAAIDHMLWEEGTWVLEDNDDAAWADPRQGGLLRDLAVTTPDRYPLV